MEMKLDYADISFQNNGKLKLLIIVGTRPEIIRLAAVIQKSRKYFDCILAHTGQTRHDGLPDARRLWRAHKGLGRPRPRHRERDDQHAHPQIGRASCRERV